MIGAEDIAHWRNWIGRSDSRVETLDPESLRRYAAAIGEDLDVERTSPSLAHWAFFLPVATASEIGEDGHPHRGGFLPPVSLPRRMFASSTMRFGERLMLGREATRHSMIVDVRHRQGQKGDLVLVDVEHRIVQNEAECVFERQSIVFRQGGERTAPVDPIEQSLTECDRLWQPGPIDLFRFSAVTFNSHRIHYDQPYATEVELYPELVVHGPLTAAKLFGHAARDRLPARGFSFRAMAPLFVSQPIRLTRGGKAGEYCAIRCDGVVAMAASVER